MGVPVHDVHPVHPDPSPPEALAVVVPARDAAARIAATVRAVRTIPGVDVVVVVDDGSRDATLRAAAEAGAVALRHPHPRGRAVAIESGAARVSRLDLADHVASPRALLFVDADLADVAAWAQSLAGPVMAGEADMTIAIAPSQNASGTTQLVDRLAGTGIRRATGWEATQPLSGLRCITRAAFDGARPLARGGGLEAGLTIDVLLAGFRVAEVPCEVSPPATPAHSGAGGRLERAAQGRDVARALAVRRLRRAAPLRVLRVLPHK